MQSHSATRLGPYSSSTRIVFAMPKRVARNLAPRRAGRDNSLDARSIIGGSRGVARRNARVQRGRLAAARDGVQPRRARQHERPGVPAVAARDRHGEVADARRARGRVCRPRHARRARGRVAREAPRSRRHVRERAHPRDVRGGRLDGAPADRRRSIRTSSDSPRAPQNGTVPNGRDWSELDGVGAQARLHRQNQRPAAPFSSSSRSRETASTGSG